MGGFTEARQPSGASAEVRKWSLECFVQGRTPSRNHVRQLREWVTERVERLRRTYKGSSSAGGNIVMYGEQVIDVYNSAFHELTRQVSLTCADHGKFMADLWTSAHQILGTILVHTKAQQEGYKAVASALQSKDITITTGCERLQQELVEQHRANMELREHIKQLEKRLEQAQEAAWDNKKAKAKPV